jgi:hypothetical protein
MQKEKGVILSSVLLILVISVFSSVIVSAGWFSEITGRVTGDDAEDNVQCGESECLLNDKCFAEGARKSTRYCSEGEFIVMKKSEVKCSNNYECVSNECFAGKCLSVSALEKLRVFLRGGSDSSSTDDGASSPSCSGCVWSGKKYNVGQAIYDSDQKTCKVCSSSCSWKVDKSVTCDKTMVNRIKTPQEVDTNIGSSGTGGSTDSLSNVASNLGSNNLPAGSQPALVISRNEKRLGGVLYSDECIDSDGGFYPQVKGQATKRSGKNDYEANRIGNGGIFSRNYGDGPVIWGKPTVISDTCSGNQLIEMSCVEKSYRGMFSSGTDVSIVSKLFDCPNSCKNGVCL